MKNSLVQVTVAEFCEREGVDYRLVLTLVELEIAQPIAGDDVQEWVFDATGARWLEKALCLKRDLELEWDAIGMLVLLMRQREELQRENAALQQRLRRFLAD